MELRRRKKRSGSTRECRSGRPGRAPFSVGSAGRDSTRKFSGREVANHLSTVLKQKGVVALEKLCSAGEKLRAA